jgi:hypothetical protein
MLGHMNVSLQTKHMIRAGGIFFLGWLVVFAVMFVAFYGFLPRGIDVPVFRYAAACVFPYERSGLSDTVTGILTASHWVLSIPLFAFLGYRLPARWAFVASLLTISLLALLVRSLFHLLRFS